MSIELKLFPEDVRSRIINKLTKESQNQLLPVVLFFHKQKLWKAFKQYHIVAIDPTYSLHQLIQMLQVKLTWKGYLTDQNKSLFINVGDIQITTSLDQKVKTIYDQYKKNDGWLQLNITSLNSFG